MFRKILVLLLFCFLVDEGCGALPDINIKVEQVLEEYSIKAEKIWDFYIKQYIEQGTSPSEIRLFDPAQGRSDCEEQATILMDLLLQKKYFKEFDSETQQYITFRFLWVPTRFLDPFGMTVDSSKDSKFLQALDEEVIKALRQKISAYVDKRIMELANVFLPRKIVEDSAFTHTPVGVKGLTRISTTAGCMVLFEFAKEHDIKIVLRIKRMKPENGGLRGIAEHFIGFRYDPREKIFKPYTFLDSDFEQPAFFIRAFSIQGDDFSKQWNEFSGVRSEEDYVRVIKGFDLEKLIWLIASGDDYAKKRCLETSEILKLRLDFLDSVPADVDYTIKKDGKEVYAAVLTPLAIRHIYVSTLKEQKDHAAKGEDLSNICTENFVSFEPDNAWEEFVTSK